MTEPPPAGAPPKLIIVTHEFAPFRGGVATYVEEVAGAIHQLGAAVEVWAPDYGTLAAAETFSCPVVRLRSGGSLRIGHVAQLARELAARRALLEPATVVLASVGAHLAMMQLAPVGLARGGRVVSLLHGSEVLRFEGNPLWRRLARNFYRRVDAVVTVSEFSRALIGKSFLAPLVGEVAMARCACSSAAARTVAARRADDGKVRVFTLARIHPRKGQVDTARALGRLPEELRARIIYQVGGTGDADYLKKIEQSCREGGVAFEYLGAITEDALAAAYAQCDIFAMTSRSLARSVEGFGITYLDAGFHGKPVVGYRSGGVAEAVVDGETGLLVDEGDLAALAGAFEKLIADRELRERLGAGGRKHVQGFSWAATGMVFMRLSELCLEKRPPSRRPSPPRRG